jgi:hypothetical protein
MRRSRLRVTGRAVRAGVCLSLLAFAARPAVGQRVEPLAFAAEGHTFHGDWRADITISRDAWRPGQDLRIDAALRFPDTYQASLADAGIKADRLCLLVTAERTFDADGWMRLASDERMSTLLTPTGLAIEGGVQGAVTNRYGYPFKSPFDQFVSIPFAQSEAGSQPGTRVATFSVRASLPEGLPPGLYRLRFDFGVMAGTRIYNFNGFSFATRGFSDQAGTCTYVYSPIVPASGPHVSGRLVDATRLQPRFPWLLLASYNSNGYRGVVADEDRARFATSDRNLIPDEVILPMYDDNGNRLAYSLEPQFPADSIDANQNLPWDWTTGELTVQISGPDGTAIGLGTASFRAKSGNGPTTKNAAFTQWRPQKYGRYTVRATGWIADSSGRRYEGGGTYRFWIAKRMTLATATFQGQPYPVGSTYGRDIQFNPAVPADVLVTAALYVTSDATNVRTLSYSGKASTAGIFGAAQGMKSFPLSAPGEYHALVTATHTDADGHLWVCTMRHAGIVYPEPSPVVARGKKFNVGGKYVERGETKREGFVEPDGTSHLEHITFPYLAGDVLLIGAEGQGANKIEPVLTYQMQGDTSAWDTKLNGVGTTNLRIATSNGYSPHLFPEYITDLEYYYAAAPRPGFMGRFLVGESVTRAPYWPVSPNSFGGQIGASPNGDAPGDIYRLIGGVVLRRAGQAALYSGYIASAFLLPKGTNNNRVVAPGSEDLHGPMGDKARFFLVGLRPGTAYEVGSAFRAVAQIDPLLPVTVTFTLTWPDGRQQAASGVGDRFGSFASPTVWTLDAPGVYRYQIRATWSGFEGRMPGLPDQGGVFYVYSKARPAGATGLRIDGATHRTFSASTGTTIRGTTSATVVHYALLTPGAVIEVGQLNVSGGTFQYVFDPAAVHTKAPIYDIVSITTGRPQIGRVIHLTFFTEERGPGGSFFDVARVILRGTTLLAARAVVPAGVIASPGVVPDVVPDAAQGFGPAPVSVASAATPRALRTWDATLDRLLREGDLVRVSREDDGLLPGRTHERLQQFYRGVPIFGADATRQLDRGVSVSVFSALRFDIDLDPTPKIEAGMAVAIALRRTGGEPVPRRPPSLVVLPLDLVVGNGSTDVAQGFSPAQAALKGCATGCASLGYALAWRVASRTETGVLESFIDARTGGVRLEYAARPDPAITPFPSQLIAYGESGAIAGGYAEIASAVATDRLDLLERGSLVARAYFLAAATCSDGQPLAKVFTRAFVSLLPSSATFASARAATVQAARDLHGRGSALERAIADAWTALGVRD